MAATFSFIIPFHRDLPSLARALRAVAVAPAAGEIIVAADGAREDCRPLASMYDARVVAIESPAGPAAARNAAAAVASGSVLVFIDADVVVSQAGLARMLRAFDETPSLAALFGAYDEEPADERFVSQYKNLSHSFIHQSSAATARTFWAGFGAVRRDAFRAVGGFDERFRRPSVEDIDFGYRLTSAGYTVRLDPAVSACHLKRWTLRSAVASDVFDRGIPWTQLILKYGASADHLNLRAEHRWSVALAYAAAAAALLGVYDWRFLPAVPVSLAALTLINRRYYSFFYRRRGASFAARAWLLHVVHHLYNGISLAAGITLFASARYFGVRLPGCVPTDRWSASFAEGFREPRAAWRT